MDKRSKHVSPKETELLAPDGTWGIMVVVICVAILAFLFFVPSRAGASPSSKYYLAGFTLLWMSFGVRRIAAARAWKKRHRQNRA